MSCFERRGKKVADEDVNKWLQGFVKVRQSYSENDIFNINETGVFYNFPPNCTSRLQPLNQGIIAAFKRYFKTRLVRHALLCLDSDQPCVKWNILQAMRAMAVSWNDVTATTISNCFKKAWNIENDANLSPKYTLRM